jgi:anti-anti-sigma factor
MAASDGEPLGDRQGQGTLATAAATISVQVGRSVAMVRVAGKIDMVTVSALREALSFAVDGAVRRVLVDLAAVTFLDVGGVGALATAADRLRNAGRGQLVVVDPSAVVRRILQLTGVDQQITIRTSAVSDGGS